MYSVMFGIAADAVRPGQFETAAKDVLKRNQLPEINMPNPADYGMHSLLTGSTQITQAIIDDMATLKRAQLDLQKQLNTGSSTGVPTADTVNTMIPASAPTDSRPRADSIGLRVRPVSMDVDSSKRPRHEDSPTESIDKRMKPTTGIVEAVKAKYEIRTAAAAEDSIMPPPKQIPKAQRRRERSNSRKGRDSTPSHDGRRTPPYETRSTSEQRRARIDVYSI